MNERELQDAVKGLPTSIEPPRDLWPGIQDRIDRRSSRRRWYWIAAPLAAAAALVAVLIGKSGPVAWDVAPLAGRPLLGTKPLVASGRLRVGDWLQTDDSSRALIAVGRIGQVKVRPGTRVQLVAARADDHRLALARGTIDAKVDAIPRLFFVETPAGTAIDLGCAYTLETDSLGNGWLHVTGGEVEFQTGERSARVPLGAMVQIRPAPGGAGGAGGGQAFPMSRTRRRRSCTRSRHSLSRTAKLAPRAPCSRSHRRRTRSHSGISCNVSIHRSAPTSTIVWPRSCRRRPA